MKQKTDIVRKELKQNSDVDENYPRIIFVDSMLNINTCNIKYTIIFSEGKKRVHVISYVQLKPWEKLFSKNFWECMCVT